MSLFHSGESCLPCRRLWDRPSPSLPAGTPSTFHAPLQERLFSAASASGPVQLPQLQERLLSAASASGPSSCLSCRSDLFGQFRLLDPSSCLSCRSDSFRKLRLLSGARSARKLRSCGWTLHLGSPVRCSVGFCSIFFIFFNVYCR